MSEMSPEIYITVFGKHPGWDDHIEDFSQATQLLTDIKRILYHEGIGSNIDSGSWESLPAEQMLEGFKHLFVWCAGSSIVVGRMWSSSDGKGRSRYPLVVCVQCSNIPVQWIIDKVLPALEVVENECCQAATAAEVHKIIDDLKRKLKLHLSVITDDDKKLLHELSVPDVISRLAEYPEMGEAREGLYRIFYVLDQDIAYFDSQSPDTRSTTRIMNSVQLRVPGCETDPAEIIKLWKSFADITLSSSSTVLLLLRLDQDWLDLGFGKINSRNFYGLRASQLTIPLTSEIPFTYDSIFEDKVENLIRMSKAGLLKPPSYLKNNKSKTNAAEGNSLLNLPRKLFGDARKTLINLLEVMPLWQKITVAVSIVVVVLLLIIIFAVMGGDDDKTSLLNRESESAGDKLINNLPETAGGTSGGSPVISSERAEKWSRLCTEYYNWYGSFSDYLISGSTPSKVVEIKSDKHIYAIYNALYNPEYKDNEVNPSLIAQSNLGLLELAKKPPVTIVNEDVYNQVNKALGIIDSVKSNLESWDAPDYLRDMTDKYRERKWLKAVTEIKEISDNISTTDGEWNVQAIPVAVKLRASLKQVEENYSQTQIMADTLSKSGIPLFTTYPEFFLNTTVAAGAVGVDTLTTVIKQDQQLAAQLIEFLNDNWENKIDHALVMKVPELWLVKADTLPSEESYRQWVKKVSSGSYDTLDPALDPRRDRLPQWEKIITDINNTQTEYTKRFKENMGATLQNHVKSLTDEVSDTNKLVWNQKNKSEIERRTSNLDKELPEVLKFVTNELADKIKIMETSIRDYKLNLKARNEISLTASSALNSTWCRQRDVLINNIDDYPLLVKKINELETFLRAMETDSVLPQNLDAALARVNKQHLPQSTDLPEPAQWDRERVNQILNANREKILTSGTNLIEWNADGSLAANKGFNTQWESLVSNYNNQITSIYNTITGMALLEGLLNQGYGNNEIITDTSMISSASGISSADTLKEIFAVYQKESLYPSIAEAFSAITNRIQDLDNISAIHDASQLLGFALSLHDTQKQNVIYPELRLAAWRGLQTLDNWPADVESLDNEIRLRDTITAWSGFINSKIRQNQIIGELKQAGPETWRKYVENCDSDSEFARVQSAARAFNVSVDDNKKYLSPQSNYNLLLYDLKTQTDWASLSDEDIVNILVKLQTAIGQIDVTQLSKEAGANIAEIALLASEMSINQTPETDMGNTQMAGHVGIDYTKIGPGSGGWDFVKVNTDNSNGGGREEIEYKWKCESSGIEHHLKFFRFNGENTDYYLSSTEMSAGLFIDVINTSDAQADMIMSDILWDFEPLSDSRAGPRVWTWKNLGTTGKKQMVIADYWLFNLRGDESSFYQAEINHSVPDATHPMNWVSPQAAFYISQLLGCRLPTVPEWQTAYKIIQNDGNAGDKNNFNLRDVTWYKQWDYAKSGELNTHAVNPASGIFHAEVEDKEQDENPSNSNILNRNNYDDKYLWFRKINDGGYVEGLHHLVGNVSEYVLTNWLDTEVSVNKDLKQIVSYFESNPLTVKIIGASALSPEVLSVDQPYALDLYYARDGYSDVGFRLAFSAPQISPVTKLQRIVLHHVYITN